MVFDVDGFRFGMAICIEINFSDLFADYDRLGVDCLLLSAYPVDSIFAIKARAYAAIHRAARRDAGRCRPRLDIARPWRATARAAEIYEERRVRDERIRVRTEF